MSSQEKITFFLHRSNDAHPKWQIAGVLRASEREIGLIRKPAYTGGFSLLDLHLEKKFGRVHCTRRRRVENSFEQTAMQQATLTGDSNGSVPKLTAFNLKAVEN